MTNRASRDPYTGTSNGDQARSALTTVSKDIDPKVRTTVHLELSFLGLLTLKEYHGGLTKPNLKNGHLGLLEKNLEIVLPDRHEGDKTDTPRGACKCKRPYYHTLSAGST